MANNSNLFIIALIVLFAIAGLLFLIANEFQEVIPAPSGILGQVIKFNDEVGLGAGIVFGSVGKSIFGFTHTQLLGLSLIPSFISAQFYIILCVAIAIGVYKAISPFT